MNFQIRKYLVILNHVPQTHLSRCRRSMLCSSSLLYDLFRACWVFVSMTECMSWDQTCTWQYLLLHLDLKQLLMRRRLIYKKRKLKTPQEPRPQEAATQHTAQLQALFRASLVFCFQYWSEACCALLHSDLSEKKLIWSQLQRPLQCQRVKPKHCTEMRGLPHTELLSSSNIHTHNLYIKSILNVSSLK